MHMKTESADTGSPLFNPLTGWEAATRWNAATFDWMARGFQQWLTLMTTLPPHPVIPVAAPDIPARTDDAREERSSTSPDSRLRTRDEPARAVAKAEPKRSAPRRAARPKAAAKARSRG